MIWYILPTTSPSASWPAPPFVSWTRRTSWPALWPILAGFQVTPYLVARGFRVYRRLPRHAVPLRLRFGRFSQAARSCRSSRHAVFAYTAGSHVTPYLAARSIRVYRRLPRHAVPRRLRFGRFSQASTSRLTSSPALWPIFAGRQVMDYLVACALADSRRLPRHAVPRRLRFGRFSQAARSWITSSPAVFAYIAGSHVTPNLVARSLADSRRPPGHGLPRRLRFSRYSQASASRRTSWQAVWPILAGRQVTPYLAARGIRVIRRLPRHAVPRRQRFGRFSQAARSWRAWSPADAMLQCSVFCK